MNTEVIQSSDPRVHARNVGGMLDEMVQHVRKDIGQFDEPNAQALSETAAEVLLGLRKAFEHYETGSEAAMR
jgi:hypothetical protein